MKSHIKQFTFSLLFCLIFIGCFMCNNNNIYAVTIEGYVPTIKVADIKSAEIGTTYNNTDKNCDWSVTGNKIKIEFIGEEIKKYFCNKFIEASQNKFMDMDFIFDVKVEGTLSYLYIINEGPNITGNCKVLAHTSCWEDKNHSTLDESFPITSIDADCLDNVADGFGDLIKISFTMGEDTYIFKTHTLRDAFACGEKHGEKYYKNNMPYSKPTDSVAGIGGVRGDNAYQMAKNAQYMLKYFQECAIEGIIAGSVGAGFNVATPYSDNQLPLSDVMELNTGGYDFKTLSSAKYTLDYYYSPIFGKLYAYKDPLIPRTTDEWIDYGVANVNTFIKDNSIILADGFIEFANSLSTDSLNEKGEKISSITIENGAKKMGLLESTNPQTVLSYNVEMAVPFLFTVTDGKAQMVPNKLRIIDNYTFNLFLDKIYTNDTITLEDGSVGKYSISMVDVLGSGCRDYIYLYHQNKTIDIPGTNETRDVKVGIILIALFDECVVDTTTEYDESRKTSNLYLTGRKIGLDNGYSDVLNIKNANSDLMFVQGSNSVKTGFVPLNVVFPETTENLRIHNLHNTFTGLFQQTEPEIVDAVNKLLEPWSDDDFYEHINNREMHGKVPESVQVMHFLIEFDKVLLNSGDEGTDDTGVYRFFCIRNNNYIYDESLLEWLKSDEAQSLSYVKASELIAKITGDFSGNIKDITYREWLAMQEIKKELDRDKDRWLIGVMNVMATVFGTTLIIFAVLFIMAYWIDIFNPFTEFSILKFISFGNLYSVSSYDIGEYIGKENGCKYVTFKDVFIIACIMIAFGLLFFNVESIFYFIIYMYNYFLKTLGGVFSW